MRRSRRRWSSMTCSTCSFSASGVCGTPSHSRMRASRSGILLDRRHVDGLVVDGHELERHAAPVISITAQVDVDEARGSTQPRDECAESGDDDRRVERQESRRMEGRRGVRGARAYRCAEGGRLATTYAGGKPVGERGLPRMTDASA